MHVDVPPTHLELPAPNAPSTQREETSAGNSKSFSSQPKSSSNAPGAAWNNKKAQDEYDRAMVNITDKAWSMARFGELLAGGRNPPANPPA